MEVYRLDENAHAHLINAHAHLINAHAHLINKQKVYRGEVQNGFLFTQKIDDYRRVCIEPLPKN